MTKPTNYQIAAVFDTVASSYENLSYPYTVRRRHETVLNMAKGKCLEVGAGTGALSRQLVDKGFSVVATDIAPGMVKEIQKKVNIPTGVCDAEKLPFPASSFDTVIAAEVIYYLDHPKRFISEAYRVLKPSGQLLITSANAGAVLYDRLRTVLRRLGVWRLYFDDPVTDFMTSSTLQRLLKEGGFQTIDMRQIIIFPIASLAWVNELLERTWLSHLGMFIVARGQK